MSALRKAGPLSRGKAVVLAWGTAHPTQTAFGACLGICALGVLLLWFMVFSGMNEPVQFVYASF